MSEEIKNKIENNIEPFTSVKPKTIAEVLRLLNNDFRNGITGTDGVVKLGGEITEDTLIVAGDITSGDARGVYISPTAKQVALINYNNPTVANLSLNADGKITLSNTNSANSDTAYLEISEDRDLTLGTGLSSLGERRVDIHTEGSFLITDSITNKGLEYGADYSSNFTDRSLVDKYYVDSKKINFSELEGLPEDNIGLGLELNDLKLNKADLEAGKVKSTQLIDYNFSTNDFSGNGISTPITVNKDSTPVQSSTNAITSGYVYQLLQLVTVMNSTISNLEQRVTDLENNVPPDIVPPTVPDNIQYTKTDKTITLTWDASTDDSGGVVTYELDNNGALVTSSSSGYNYVGLEPETLYTIKIRAVGFCLKSNIPVL